MKVLCKDFISVVITPLCPFKIFILAQVASKEVKLGTE
jgi:hypothetical protein